MPSPTHSKSSRRTRKQPSARNKRARKRKFLLESLEHRNLLAIDVLYLGPTVDFVIDDPNAQVQGSPYVEVLGSYDGVTNKTSSQIIDFTAAVGEYAPEIHGDAIPAIQAKDGNILYPIDSTFGFVGTDFVGAVDKTLDGVHREGWVGNKYDADGNPIGLLLSDVETDTFLSTLPLGTWAAGLGGNSVKASTEHFVVMNHLLASDARPLTNLFDPNGDGDPSDAYSNLALIGGTYDGWRADAAIADAGDTNGDGQLDLRDVMAPNESSVIQDIAVSYNADNSPEYSVTLKDDGKLLYRWGTMIKRPNDIRLGVHMPLPDEWVAASTDPNHPGFVISSAELQIRHTITNNPNDQIRPEDLENELATGRKPSYHVIAHPDPAAPAGAFLWVSDRNDYAGDGTFLPSYFELDEQGEIVTDAGPRDLVAYDLAGNLVGVVATDDAGNPLGTVFRDSTQADPVALSADLRDGFTWQWYTTMDRDPFEPAYDDNGEELSGPRWRLKSNKFGQDVPGMEIPLFPGSEPPFSSDNIKYEVGEETVTIINLLDGAGLLDNGIDLRISDHWTSLLTDDAGNIIDERFQTVDSAGRIISVNGLELTDGFDFSIYIKGDRKPIELYDAQLVITYQVNEAFDHGDAPASYEVSDPARARNDYREFPVVDDSGTLQLDDQYNVITRSVPNYYLGEPVQLVTAPSYSLPAFSPDLTPEELAAITAQINAQLALLEPVAISDVIGEADIDAELLPLSSPDALGDDQQALADEEGIRFKTVVAPGQATRIEVAANLGLERVQSDPDAAPDFVVGPQAGYLYGWMDTDGSGTFEEAERLVFGTQLDDAGNEVPVYGAPLQHGELTQLEFTVPADAQLGTTVTRFRLSPVAVASEVLPTGEVTATTLDPLTGATLILNQGELEDHQVLVTNVFDDVVGRDRKDGQWWVGLSDGNRFQERSYNAVWDPKAEWRDVMVVDLNGDGVDDLAGRTLIKSKKDTDRWSWAAAVSRYIPAGVDDLGNPTGDRWTFDARANWATWPADVTWDAVAAVDFNGDGRDEIVGRDQDGKWTLSSYDDSFHDQLNVVWNGDYADTLAGDFNGDGKEDLAARNSDGKWEVITYAWTTTANFTGVQFESELWDGAPWDPTQTYRYARTADVNGDGRDDLVAQIAQTGQWIVARSRTSSTGNDGFDTDKWGGTNPNLNYLNVLVGDVNDDGRDDLITRTDDQRFLVEVSTGEDFSTQNFGAWDRKTKWVDVVAGDFNGDQRTDVAGRDEKTGQWTAGLSTGDDFAFGNFGNWDRKTKWVSVMAGDFDDPAWSVFQDPDQTNQLVLQLDSELAAASPAVTVTGEWTEATIPSGFLGANYLLGQDTDGAADHVTFAPELPASGRYAIYLNWVPDSGRSSNVPVEVSYGYGSTHQHIIDQTLAPDVLEDPAAPDGDNWYALGAFNLVAGVDGAVRVSVPDASGTVSVDAVRYVYLGALDAPVTALDSEDNFSPDTNTPLDPTRSDLTFTGSWQATTANPGYEGAFYLTETADARATEGESVTFAPNLPLGGFYHVYLNWNQLADPLANATYREASVPVSVANASGNLADLVINQQEDPDGDGLPGGWAKLGTFALQAGNGGAAITVSDAGTAGDLATVVVDAVRLVWVGFDFQADATDGDTPGDSDPDGAQGAGGGSTSEGDLLPGESLQRLTPGEFDFDGDSATDYISPLHVFTIDDVLGDFAGTTYADDASIIDVDGNGTVPPIVSKDGVTLSPIDSAFGYFVTDFVGAVQKVRDGLHTEGWVGNIEDDAGQPIGMELSDAKTDLFKSGLPLGTWLTGLGGVTVKASTEHYNVMAEILGLDASPENDTFRQIDLSYDPTTGDFTPNANHLKPYSAQELLDAWNAGEIEPNESSVIQDIFLAFDPSAPLTPLYSVTFKDDGKLLYRWGTAIKRPNDIRLNARLALPAAWTDDTQGPPLVYRVTTANLRVNHTITNNPNDQIRPEDLENELASGRLPSYIQIAHPDDLQNPAAFLWVSFVDDYAGDGTFLPSYFKLDGNGDPELPTSSTPSDEVIYAWIDGVLTAVGVRNRDVDGNISGTVLRDSQFVDVVPLSSDRELGYTAAWYTTMDRDPFEPNLQYTADDAGPFQRVDPDPSVDGDEFLVLVQPGPRWRLQAGKFGQDLPGVDIPRIAHSRPPFTSDNIKYEVGQETTTLINLLDGAGQLDNGVDLRFSNFWTGVITDAAGNVTDERVARDDAGHPVSRTEPDGSTSYLSVNGVWLSKDFDFSVYIKGDRKPTDLYDAQLVLEYEIDVALQTVAAAGTVAATIGDVPGVTYSWQVDQTPVPDAQTSTFDVAAYLQAQGLPGGVYEVSLNVTDRYGTGGNAALTVDVVVPTAPASDTDASGGLAAALEAQAANWLSDASWLSIPEPWQPFVDNSGSVWEAARGNRASAPPRQWTDEAPAPLPRLRAPLSALPAREVPSRDEFFQQLGMGELEELLLSRGEHADPWDHGELEGHGDL